MIDWLHTYWGAVVALVALLVGLKNLFDYLEQKIEKHAPLRDWLMKWLVVPNVHDAYRDWLDRRLDGLRTWMGKPWSGTALLRCLAIAFAYPTALLLISYGSGGPGTVGATEFFPSLGGWRQALLGFGLLTVTAVLALVVALSERIDRHLLGGIEQCLRRRGIANPQRRARWLYRIGAASAVASLWLAAVLYAGVSVAVAGAVAVAVAVAVALAGARARAGALAVAGAVALAVAVAGTFAVALAVALALALAGAVAVAVAVGVIWRTGVTPLSLAWLLFFIILPVANALLDWPSWAVSRWLAHDVSDLMRDRPRALGTLLRRLFRGVWKPAMFIVHVAVDLLAAIALLAVLAVLLPFLVQAFNNLVVASGGTPPLELGGYLQAAVRQPWPDGAWAISMLLTTLIPTALHAAAAIAMLLLLPLQAFGWRARLAAGLAADDGPEHVWAVTRASWLVVLTPLVASALVVGLGYGLVRLIGAVWEPVAILLLEAAQFGIAKANDLALAFGWLPLSGGS